MTFATTATQDTEERTPTRDATNPVPIVRVPHTTYAALQRICAQAHDRGTETHFYLLGERTPDTITILEVVRAGTPIEHAAFTQPDYEAAPEALAPYLRDGHTQLGEGHLHPDDLLGPSSGDRRTLRSIDRERFPGYVCLVATYMHKNGLALTAHSVTLNGDLQEHAVHVLPDEHVTSHLFYNPLVPAHRSNIAIAIFGLGSGGCHVALQLSKHNPRAITLVDNDRFEERNIQRHLADRRSIGHHKTAWMKRFLQQRGTTTTIKTSNRQVNPQNRAWLDKTIASHDLIVNATGHPVASNLISEAARRVNRTVLHAGAFPKGKGGFVFRQLGDATAPCYACLFHLTKQTTNDNAETLDQLTRDYGFTPEELAGHIGLWTDVTMISTLHAKIILETLKRDPTPKDANLWIVDNHHLTITHYRGAQDPNCTTCHPAQFGHEDAMTATLDA
ncbi:MAG: HesA/MoeB/ThiF family protein [Solirubrobacteraceae bacterium]